MDEEHIRDLIREVATHGEGIPLNMSGSELRSKAGDGPSARSNRRVDRGGSPLRRPFGHAAAMAWFAGIAALVVAAVVLVGAPSSRHSNTRADSTTTTSPKPSTTIVHPSVSQGALSRAVAATDATGNFDMSFVLTGATGIASPGLTGSGAADLNPIAMTLNHVEGVSLAFSPDNAWEQLGAPDWQEYTIPAFGAYADGVVGDTAGALGTFAFCSPTGLFDLTQSSIGPTTEVGPATVDGQSTTEYAVTIDPTSFLDSPGISTGELQAMQSAISLLGGASILDDVYIDASGDIVRTVSSADGASLQVDLSNFGGAGTVTLPPQQSTVDSSTTSPSPVTEYCGTGVTPGSGNTTGHAVTTTTSSEPPTTLPTTGGRTSATTVTTTPITPTTGTCIGPSYHASAVTTIPPTSTTG